MPQRYEERDWANHRIPYLERNALIVENNSYLHIYCI